ASTASCSCTPRHLPSFPTRRSSDLVRLPASAGRRRAAPAVPVRPARTARGRDGAGAGGRIRRALAIARTGIGTGLSAAAPRCLRSEEHTSELQSRENLVCRLLLEKK